MPFNIFSAALITRMLAQQCDLEPAELIWNGGDVHLYLNHLDQAEEQLSRAPRPFPTLTLAPRDDLFAYELSDVTLEGYDPWPHIKAVVAV